MRLLSLTGFSVQLFTGLLSPAAHAARVMCVRAASNTTFRLGLVAVITTLGVMACDRVNLTAPTGSTISLSVGQSVLPLGGQTTVTAVVTESAGTPVHNGTVVTFQTTVGSLNPAEATTTNGVATTTLVAGSTSGTATVHAFSGGARTGSGNSSSGGVQVKIGAAAAAGTISMQATPSSVSQSGGTVTVSAIVFDEASNPLPGVNVQFTSSSGSLSQTTATTDSSGTARTQLTTSQTATVNAIAGAAKGEVRVEASVAPTATVAASPSPATVGSPVAITVTPTNSSGRQVQSLTVDFGDGTSETRSNITGPASFTHTYQREGGVIISARLVDVAGNTGVASTALVVNRSQPTVDLTGPTTAVSLAAPTNGVAAFTVSAQATAGQPPIQSVVVRLSDGTVIYSGSAGGAFTWQFTTAGPKAVTATVTDAAGGVSTDSVIVNVTS
jgi:hypothetical protein